ncbi:hypothetical protein OAQ62_01730 [bacterium]|nr:hypothetical protein [bacterium]
MQTDSWGRPKQSVYDLTSLKQGELLIRNELPKEATPEEQAEWFETDFFMKGDFDVMKMFVVIPAVIQVVVFGMMLAVMLLNQYIF